MARRAGSSGSIAGPGHAGDSGERSETRRARRCTIRPVQILTPPKRHPRYLSLDERVVIADLRREKRTVREIARELGRFPATISRELRRNVDDHGRYLPRSADRAATERIDDSVHDA